MKLTVNNNARYKIASFKNDIKRTRNVSFGAADPNFVNRFFQKTVSKVDGSVVYSNPKVIASAIDSVLGEDFFAKNLQNIGVDVESGANEILIKDSSFIVDFYKTIKYPFVDLPLDLANFFFGNMKKVSFLKDLSERVLNTKLLKKRADFVQREKSIETVKNILNAFAKSDAVAKTGEQAGSYSVEKCLEAFKNDAVSNLSKVPKNYNSRDERTLNRAMTSTVSAFWGANDFYNISMLQKDDKKEAKKASNSRLKQELTRMGFNSVTTFFTLGVLNKYTKNSLPFTVATIVGSAFLAEVASRIINKVPLKPLSPKKAEKIAKEKKHENKTQQNDAPVNNAKEKNTASSPTFKNKYNLEHNNAFARFAGKDGSFSAINVLMDNTAKTTCPSTAPSAKKHKKADIKLILAGVFGISSILYFLSNALKGKYSKAMALKSFTSNNLNRFKDYLERDISLDKQVSKYISDNVIENLGKKTHEGILGGISKAVNTIGNAFKNITNKKVKISKKDMTANIDSILNTEEGQKIKTFLEVCKEQLNKSIEDKGEIAEVFVKRNIISGFADGFKKIFDTLKLILTAPAALLDGAIDKIFFKESRELYNKVAKKLNNKAEIQDDALKSLYKIFKKYGTTPKAVKEIKKSMRVFNSGTETSEIANYSRAFVTLISSYFFVNDYYNKVLIESEGKNIEEAQEERKERIAHKLSNFVVNGTLMNVFNSVFNKSLNNSLIQATLIAGATEMTNEFLVRKSICQPTGKMKSKDDIIEWEEKQISKKGIVGAWSRIFRKITGKKTLTEKAHIDIKKEKELKEQKAKNA